MRNYFLFILIFTCCSFAKAQGPSKILLIDGFLHAGDGTTMPSALVAIENGEILFIKNSLAYTFDKSEWDTIIDLAGRHIYPGFIAPNSTLGITEIDAVRATRDYNEIGNYNPHVRTQVAYNVESKVISTVRTNGVLLTQCTPKGGIITGSSSVMKMDGWNWEDATVLKDDGIHLRWPNSLQGRTGFGTDKPISKSEKYEERKKAIYQFFEMAQSYSKTHNKNYFDQRLEAMRTCFNGTKRVYIKANELQQLVDVLEFVKHFNLKYPVIVGGYDAHLIGKQISDAKIPIMLLRTHSLPRGEDDDVDLPYKLPFLLKEAGVEFCLQNEGDMEAMNGRNLPFLAGTAMAYGLSEEEAVTSISLSSAKIIGVDKKYGSIEKGKSATLFVSDGNALDMRSNQMFLALIDGVFISTSNSQKELYLKYKSKYESNK